MAAGEITGRTAEGIENLREEHHQNNQYTKYGVSFEDAFCLVPIGKQPDEYDGPQRYCTRRSAKVDDYEGNPRDSEAFAPNCPSHGGECNGGSMAHNLDDPKTAAMKHGLWAEDEHLRMDFNDAEQELYDWIVESWPDIYDWPDEDEDPARYLILRKVATNVVRSERAEDYLDDEGEVRITDRFNDEGIVVEPDGQHDENPISGEYRLLIGEIVDMLKELGVTPRERAKMDAEEATADAASSVAELASSALGGDDAEYDPTRFEDDAQT